jgi:ubiquinone biosynthesis protein COQ9
MRSPFADAERERLIAAILPEVPFDGWTFRALRNAARHAGIPPGEAVALFPRGAPDLITAFSHWADRRMIERMDSTPAEPVSLSRRVALALRLRFEVLLPWREAVRRGLSVLAMPHNAPLGARLLYDTVDAVWYAVGDQATDFSFYTKRASLAGIYVPAMLYWLDDRSPEFTDTQAFVERRLADLGRISAVRRRFSAAAESLPRPFRLMRPHR